MGVKLNRLMTICNGLRDLEPHAPERSVRPRASAETDPIGNRFGRATLAPVSPVGKDL